MRSIIQIKDELDLLQEQYLKEDDENELISIEFRFSCLLAEATEVDGILRHSRGVTIHNWVREE